VRRLLLTSDGIRNDALRAALSRLVGKPFAKSSVAVISVAPNGAAGDQGRPAGDLDLLRGLGWRELDTLELGSLPAATVIDRLRRADVVYAGGDNPYILADSIIANGLDGRLAGILESKVWAGAGAGSMIFSRFLSRETGEAFGDHDELRALGEAPARPASALFNWYVVPRLNGAGFPNRTPERVEKVAARASFPVYALDDDSALRVRGDSSDVVSEGKWLLLNAPYSQALGGTSSLPPFTSERTWRLPTIRASYRFVRRLPRR
jgi:dipeptidase E